MDEPLSNLDAKLRVQMRTEVSRIQNRLETTTVYVTHDQTEAMTLGDRVAVMRKGVLQQVGTPAGALRPARQPVRRRLHRLAVDELHAGRDLGPARRSCRSPRSSCRSETARALESPAGKKLLAGIRPEHFEDASLVGDQRARLRGQGRHPRVDGLRALRLLRRRGRGRLRSEQLDELAADAGAELGSSEPAQPDRRPTRRREQGRQGEKLELWMDADRACTSSTSTGDRIEPGIGAAAQRPCFSALLAQPLDDLARPTRGCGAACSAVARPADRRRPRCRCRSGRPPRGPRRPARTRRRTRPRQPRAVQRPASPCISRKPQASTPSASSA